MIEQFKIWMEEVKDKAIADKHEKAKVKGDETKWKKEIWKSPKKNTAIKNRFRDEGANLGYKSRPSYVTNAGEWLYDFVWRQFNDDGHLINVVLTMEIEVSEMHEKGIQYDFDKLLQADSMYKILVFQLKTEGEVNQALLNFKLATESYNSKSDSEYLLCGWCTSKNEFIYSDFKIKV
ncbi:hypothetical protein [Psychromonas hadalis]|uniref:hypothetical protein n=1 Tax=Psychromonas hadalis TaxID=211669 RepID=UPI0003B3268A|nr:hypothetical protein [Psychromonas hadalis]